MCRPLMIDDFQLNTPIVLHMEVNMDLQMPFADVVSGVAGLLHVLRHELLSQRQRPDAALALRR